MILRSLWLRPTLAQPIRALVTVLGVAIGVASVVSTLLASRAAIASMSADVQSVAGESRLEISRPGGFETSDLEALRPICTEALLAPVIERTALSPDLGDLVRVLGVDLLIDQELRSIRLDATGEELEAARDSMLHASGVAVSESLSKDLGLGVGDEFELVIRSRRVALQIAAVFKPERFDSAWDRFILADVALAQELYGFEGRVDRIELKPRLELDLEQLALRVADLLPPTYQVNPASARRDEGERLVRALEFNLTALAGVSILVGIVLVATTLATSVVQRKNQIALLRSLGASRKQIARAILVEAGAIGLVGGSLGVVFGWIGADSAVSSVRATVATIAEGVTPGIIRLEWEWALTGISLGFFASIFAALLPLREALRTPPIQGLRSEHPQSIAGRPWKLRAALFAFLVGAAAFFASLPPLADRPIWALISALFLLSTLLVLAGPLIDVCAGIRPRFLGAGAAISVRLAQAALEASRTRAAWAASAVGVSVALAVSMTTMVGSFRQSVVDWTAQAMPSDLYVRPLTTVGGASAGTIDPALTEVAIDTFGADFVDPFHQSSARYEGNVILLGGAAFDVVAQHGGVPFLDGRPSREVFADASKRSAAVVNEPFARRYKVEAGDRISIETPAGFMEREIAGVYRDYSGHIGRVVIALDDYLTAYPNEGPKSIAIFLPPEQDVESSRTNFLQALAGAYSIEVLNNRELRAEVLRIFEGTFAVTIALQIISSLVAAIAVIAVLSALIRERRRELAVVRVLGASRTQLFHLVLSEAFLLGLAGTLGGLFIGLIVGYVLVTVVNLQSFGWSLDFVIPGSIFMILMIVIPACLLAGLAPAFMALRTAPRESLHANG